METTNSLQQELELLKKENTKLREEKQQLEKEYSILFSTLQKYERLVQSTSMLIEMANDPDQDFNKIILDTALELVPEADYGSISVIQEEDWKFEYAVGHNLEALKSIPFKKTYFYDPRVLKSTLFFDSNVFILKEASTSQNMPAEIYERYTQSMRPVVESAIVQIDLGNNLAGHLSLDIGKGETKHFSKDSLKVMEAMGSITSAFLAFQQLARVQEEFQKEIILSIIHIVEIHDSYTRGHSEHVASISLQVAKELGMNSEDCKKIYWAGLVHDIGKILVPQSILNKPEHLSDSEFDVIKNHPIWGYEVLKNSKRLKEMALFVRHHHERYDGRGYPDGLMGTSIPLTSRVLTLADSWDAMIRDRAYRKGLPQPIAIGELVKNAGSQFDPVIVKAFLHIIDKNLL